MKTITLTVQLLDIKTRRDGGGRVQFEYGAESMQAIADLMGLNASGDTVLGMALVPIGNDNQGGDDEYSGEHVDRETGEVIL